MIPVLGCRRSHVRFTDCPSVLLFLGDSEPDLNGWHNSGSRNLIIVVHQQLYGTILVNAEQLRHTLMQHRQEVMLLNEVEDCRLLLAQKDGQGKIVTALNLIQLGCYLK